jgi:Leucine-rich repeat (LRR) protein
VRGHELLRSNASVNQLTVLTFRAAVDEAGKAAANLEELYADENMMSALPNASELTSLRTLSIRRNQVLDISEAGAMMPTSLRELSIDQNGAIDASSTLKEIPAWVYRRQRNGLAFSALPLCMRGYVSPDGLSAC